MTSHRTANFVNQQSENSSTGQSTSSAILGSAVLKPTQVFPLTDNYGSVFSASIYPSHAEDLSTDEFNALFEDAHEWLNEQRFVPDVDSIDTFGTFIFDLSIISCIAASGANCICAKCLKITGQQNQVHDQPNPEPSGEIQNEMVELMQVMELDSSTADSGVEEVNSSSSTPPTISFYESDIENTSSPDSPVDIPFQPRYSSTPKSLQMTLTATSRKRHVAEVQVSVALMTDADDYMPDGPKQRRLGRSIHRPSRYNEFETSFCQIREKK